MTAAQLADLIADIDLAIETNPAAMCAPTAYELIALRRRLVLERGRLTRLGVLPTCEAFDAALRASAGEVGR